MVDLFLDVNLVIVDVEKLLYFYIWLQWYFIGQICEIMDFKFNEVQWYFCFINVKYLVDYIMKNFCFLVLIFYDCSIKMNY